MLSADLQKVSTAAGDGTEGHRDGAAMQAALAFPRNLAVLPDGRVLVSTGRSGVRILSADLQQVHTVVPHEEGARPRGSAQLPDGRVLVSNFNATITMLEGFPPALMGPKPAAKPPKKKRGLTGGASASSSGGASSPGPALKRGRSGAGPSNAAAADSSSSSEDEGAGAEAEPLV